MYKHLPSVLLLLIYCLLLSCEQKDNLFPAKGVILGYDKRTDIDCKGKLLIRINKGILNGYLATGYPSDSNCQIRSYPQDFQIDTNSRFPISVVLEYSWTGAILCKDSVINISKMKRTYQ